MEVNVTVSVHQQTGLYLKDHTPLLCGEKVSFGRCPEVYSVEWEQEYCRFVLSGDQGTVIPMYPGVERQLRRV